MLDLPAVAGRVPLVVTLRRTLFLLLLARPETVPARFVRALVAFVATLGGAVAWAAFFNGGTFLLTAHDWPKELDYFAVLGEAVTSGRLPLYASAAHQGTTFFLANPEVPLTPDVLLLAWTEPATFVLAHTLLFYAAGAAGLFALVRRYELSTLAFPVLLLLFAFNGHIASHLTAGHSMWVGTLLLPWFVLFVLRLVEGGEPRAGLVALLVVLLLAGALHVFVWCVLLLLALAVSHPASRGAVGRTLVAAGLLGAVRFVPALVALGTRNRDFGEGYAGLGHVVEALVVARPVADGWWEADLFVGLEGVLFIGVFAWSALRPPDSRWRALLFPLAAVALLSIGDLYGFLHPLPFFGIERAPARMLLVPLLVLAALAAIRAQELADAQRWVEGRWAGWWSLVFVWQLRFVLLRHHEQAGMVATGQTPSVMRPARELAHIALDHAPSVAYERSLAAGAVLSLVGVVVLVALSLRRRPGSAPA